MVIGLVGTFGAGKDALADHLQEKFGLMHVSTGDIVREIAQMQKGSIERPVLHETANELRHTYGGGVLVDRAIDRYHNSIRTYAGVVVSGLRSTGEAKKIKELGGKLVFIDAPVEVRYERIRTRQKDGEARITIDAFKERENSELYSGNTDADFNIEKIGEIADVKLQNAGDVEEFLDTAEKALQLV